MLFIFGEKMKKLLLILITVSSINVFSLENKTDVLMQCLQDKQELLNNNQKDKVVSAALTCMTGFLSEVNKEEELQLIAQNLNIEALFGFTNPYLYNSYGGSGIDLSSAGYNNISNLLNSYYSLPPLIKVPELVMMATEDDGDGNVNMDEDDL